MSLNSLMSGKWDDDFNTEMNNGTGIIPRSAMRDLQRSYEEAMSMSRANRYGFIPAPANNPYENQQRGLMNQAADKIVCPVCSSTNCQWFYEVIAKGNANQVFVDMINGMFKGDSSYVQGQNQQEYYDRRRTEFYAKKDEPSKPKEPDMMGILNMAMNKKAKITIENGKITIDTTGSPDTGKKQKKLKQYQITSIKEIDNGSPKP